MTARVVMAMQDLPFRRDHWRELEEAVEPDQLVRVPAGDDAALADALAVAEVAILAGDLDERHLASQSLKWVHCDHAGLTRSARPEVFDRGLIVTGSAGRSAEALAEHVMMFALLLNARYLEFHEAQQRHEWRRTPDMANLRALRGRTMGILGMGKTGMALTRLAVAFGMRVLGYRRRDLPVPPGVERVYAAEGGETIDPVLKEADVLALVLNLSDATHHLVGARELALMKPGSFLINLSRGAVLDQDALMAALHAGNLGGAGLDVTTPEPLPPGHPLWDTPNVLITPHFTPAQPDKTDRSLEIIIENLRRFRAGQPLMNRITTADVYTRGTG